MQPPRSTRVADQSPYQRRSETVRRARNGSNELSRELRDLLERDPSGDTVDGVVQEQEQR